MSRKWLVGRVFKAFAVLVTCGLLGAGVLLVQIWSEHRTELSLPTPTGPFVVGRTTYDWIDDGHADALAPAQETKRELLVWIWYPSAAAPSNATQEYIPAILRTPVQRSRGALISRLLTRDLSKVHAHSIPDSDVSPQQRSYPVLIMRAGASAEVWNYTTLAEDLASHGYVVVGFDAPYRTNVVVFPDGRTIRRLPQNDPELCLGMAGQEQARCIDRLLTTWTDDIAFVLDRLERFNTSERQGRFTGRLDMAKVGVFGHSFGGATALEFCCKDPRCKAGIDIDGAPYGSVIRAAVNKPFMILLSDHSGTDPETLRIKANIDSIYERLPMNGRRYIAIHGANHFMFSDDVALLKSQIVVRALRILGFLGIDGRRQLAITAYCVRSFFDSYLKGASASPPEISSPSYPEIEVLE